MKTTLLLLPLIFLYSCNPTTVESDITNGKINSEAPYMWSSSAFPRNLKISDSFEDAEVSNIQAMSNAWETATENKKNFFINTDRTPEVSRPNLDLDSLGDDNINGVYKIIDWPLELSGGALAVTQLFGRRYNIGSSDEYVRIEHADVLLNENLYNFRTSDGGPSNTYDLQTVMLHELGHFLGLGHKYGNTVMIPSVGSSTSNRSPTSVDILDIATKYKLNLSNSASSAIVAQSRSYTPRDSGQQVKIMIELMADGECVHKENGAVIKRHSLK